MQTLEYPKGWFLQTGFHHAGKFYVVLTNQSKTTRWQGNVHKFMAMQFDGTRSKEITAPAHREPKFVAHPDQPGINYMFPHSDTGKLEAINLESGKKFVLSEKKPPASESYWGYRDWLHDNFQMLEHRQYQNVRAVWNDQLVVMTGKEAESRASMLMGPTAAANVLATKGLETGYVVAYQRGGSHRILKPSRHSLTHLALADDGLVFMCCTTSNGAFLFDFDV